MKIIDILIYKQNIFKACNKIIYKLNVTPALNYFIYLII